MGWRKRRSAGLLVIGCYLMLAGSGCHPYIGPGCILRGSWSLEYNRVPWPKNRTISQQECPQSAVECPGPGCGPDLPRESNVDPIDPQQTGCVTPRPLDECQTCGSCGFCRRCGRQQRAVRVAVGYHSHPRFHPVPTRPVFSPRSGGPLPAAYDEVPIGSRAPMPPEKEPSSIPVIPPPPPTPEEIPPPPPEADTMAAPVTQAPRRLDTATRPPRWIFTPSASTETFPQRRSEWKPSPRRIKR